MFSKLASSVAVAALASGASATYYDVSGVDFSKLDYHGHYFRQEWVNQPIAVERLDPILNRGTIGTHVHSFVGANVVSADTDYNATQEATCSQVYVKADKSVYWFPTLYFQDPKNGSFTRVPEHHRVLYYFNRATDPKTNQPNFDLIEEFPAGFQMIAGDTNLRSEATTEQMRSVTEWWCHGPEVKSSGFPNNITSCPNGLAGSIRFPFCWNGDDFNPDDPHAHMSYPKTDAQGNGAADSGACPDSHPHILPTIFMEFWFDVTSFDGLYEMGDVPWVVSNGDPTGYGFHADFLNGWEVGKLENAMKTCNIGESGDPLSDCFEVYTDEERNACSQKTIVNEEVNGWLSALPGCNPLQHGPEKAVMKTDCGDTATLEGGSSNAGGSSNNGGSSGEPSSVASSAASSAAAPAPSSEAAAAPSYASTATSAAAAVPVVTEQANAANVGSSSDDSGNGNVVWVTVTSYTTAWVPGPTVYAGSKRSADANKAKRSSHFRRHAKGVEHGSH